MKAHEFDERFESGERIIETLDVSAARRPARGQKRVNVDYPQWMVDRLDREAARIGITRQSVIKMWLAERLEQMQR
jgi:hypothetical protein